LAGALVLAAIGAAAVSQQDVPLDSPLIERERVLYISLDVVIHEQRRGRWVPAHGIRAEDLKVLVSGHAVELDAFEDWCPAATGETPEQETARSAEALAGEPDAPPVSYILYFDLGHLNVAGYNMALDAAEDWAHRVPRPEDRVMIITSGLGMRIVRPLVPAGDTLERDLTAAMRGYGSDPWANAEISRADEIRGLVLDDSETAEETARALANAYASEDYFRARRDLENLQALMALFDAVEGTKNLVLFQDTLRFVPGRQYPLADRFTDLDLQLRQLVRAANERNVRIYPVVASGMNGPAEGPGAFSGLADNALTMLASETGGRVAEGSNDVGLVFDDILEDTSCFYRVGFTLPARHDGDVKRIQVLVRGGWGFRVRHRQTIVDRTEEDQEVDRVRAAFLDPERSRGIAVHAAAAPLLDHDRGSRVRIQIEVPVGELLALRSGDGTRQARLQIGGMLVPRRPGPAAAQGVMADVDTSRLPWRIASGATLNMDDTGTVAARQVALVEEVDAPPGSYWLVGVVEDELARAVGASVVELQVPERPGALGPVHLATPAPDTLLVESDKRPSERQGAPKRRKVTLAPPTLPERLLVRHDPAFREDEAAQILYAVCDPESAGKQPPGFDGWRLQRSLACGVIPDAVDLGGSRLEVEGEPCFLLVEPIPPGTLLPGSCEYDVTLERAGEAPEHRTLSFQVLPGPG
jgi:VWFA-related protein